MKKWFVRFLILIITFVLGIFIFAIFSSTPTSPLPFPQDQIVTGNAVSGDSVMILVDAEAFWSQLKADIQSSTDYIYVQTMSFEADSAGGRLANALRSQTGVDRRILGDEYSRYYSSDQFSLSPGNWSNEELKQEIAATEELADQLVKAEVRFKWGNPISDFYLNFPARNHKKLVVIDDHISYMGGFNFCDHNFEWHDMMIRIDHSNIAKMQKVDFLSTWEGYDLGGKVDFDNFQFYFFDGVHNTQTFSDIMSILEEAKDHIYIESAYMSFPFFETLRKAKKRGVDVTVITPSENNKTVMRDYIIWECVRSGFDLQMYQGKMSHLKAILVDDKTLISGSGNYDYLNYAMQIENGVVISDSTVIAKFKEQVLQPDLANAETFQGKVSNWKGYPRYWAMQIVARLALAINR